LKVGDVVLNRVPKSETNPNRFCPDGYTAGQNPFDIHKNCNGNNTQSLYICKKTN
jgi:hypothetical protein